LHEVMSIKIVTPEGVVFDTEGEFVNCPGVEGRIGILPEHTPYTAALEKGKVNIHHNGSRDSLNIGAGIVNITPDSVLIMVGNAKESK